MLLKKRLSMNKEKIQGILLAMIMVAGLVAVSFAFNRPAAKDVKYDIVFFGDSLVAGVEGCETIPDMVADSVGMKTLNAGFGGLSMAESAKEEYPGDFSYFYSMITLSELWKNNNLDTLKMAISSEEYIMPSGWLQKVEDLSKLEISSVRLILIEFGVNDYLGGNPVENAEDAYDVKSFSGALRKSIENLQEGAPDAKIVLVTPTYMRSAFGECTEYDFGGGTLEQYVDKEIEIAKEYNLPVVDNFHDGIINRENLETVTYDNLHANEEGIILISDNILKRLKEIEGLTE